jgi:hypothetical protein
LKIITVFQLSEIPGPEVQPRVVQASGKTMLQAFRKSKSKV